MKFYELKAWLRRKWWIGCENWRYVAELRQHLETARRENERLQQSLVNADYRDADRDALLTRLERELRNPMADQLLAAADMIMAQPTMNSYELRAWRADYRGYRMEKRRANH